ncbi:MAG: trimethylamine methyltransferase family protein [Rhodobacteraceae bacterium]|nr:trimethylamine methyltransferase family protein [Paracoccaceae bacterium]
MSRRPRNARRQAGKGGSGISQLAKGLIVNPYPPMEILPQQDLDMIHDTAMRVVSELGLQFQSDEAIDILEANGAAVNRDTGMVRLSPELLMEWVNKAPSKFTLHARNPLRNAIIGGNHIHFSPVSGPPNVSDLDNGRRPGSKQDQDNLIKLGQSLNILSLAGAQPVEAMELPAHTRHLDFYKSQIMFTDKVWNARAIGRGRVSDALEMVAIARGVDREQLKREPSLLTVINVNSPRIVDGEMLNGLMEMVENGQPCIITPFTLAGAMSPITLAGALAQQTAEALLVIAFTQMLNPGCPVVFGGFTSNVDMKSGAPAFGTPEYAQAVIIGGQLARRYGLPYRTSNVNASNCVDAQASYESMMSIWAAFMAHANIINHAAGWLEGGLTASFEKYILDAEMLQGLSRMMVPPVVDSASLAFEALKEVPPGGHFFGVEHTMERYKNAFYSPILSDWQNFENWEEHSGKNATERANGVWKKLLEEYVPPAIAEGIEAKLDAYIAKRKLEISAGIA